MKIKSIVLIILLLFVCVSLFANEQSKALIAKAKQFEANKKYASALGTYFDAVIADDETYENYEEAYDAFQKLSDQIKSGQPGFGNYNEFTLYDNWVLLLKDAEAYWTTNCPYVFNFSELRKENVNFEKRTADYSCEIERDYSEKYKTIVQETILVGLKQVITDNWGDLKDWPKKSAFTPKDGTPTQIYQKYGVAIVKYPSSNGHNIELLDNYIIATILRTSDAKELKEWNSLQKKERDAIVARIKWEKGLSSYYYYSPSAYYEFAPLSALEYTEKYITKGEFEATRGDGFVDIKLSLVDDRGNLMLNGPRDFVSLVGNTVYWFNNVPATIMEKIDSGTMSVVISGFFINYGDLDLSLVDFLTRKCVNNLPDVSLSVKQFENRKVSFDGLIMRKKAIEAFEAEKRGEFSNHLYSSAKEEIRNKICSKIKATKSISESELLNYANQVWKEYYESQAAQIGGENAALFPEFYGDFANDFFESEIKGKLVIIDKKGFAVLTKDGKKIAEQK